MLVEAIANLLQAEGHGTKGTDLYLYGLHDEPDEQVALREYEGGSVEFTQNTTVPYEADVRFQVVCRADTIAAAKAKAQAVWLTLSAQRNTVLDGIYYQRVLPLQAPFLIERDENNRWIVGCNYTARKEVG
jgi:hypothetical protein